MEGRRLGFKESWEGLGISRVERNSLIVEVVVVFDFQLSLGIVSIIVGGETVVLEVGEMQGRYGGPDGAEGRGGQGVRRDNWVRIKEGCEECVERRGREECVARVVREEGGDVVGGASSGRVR